MRSVATTAAPHKGQSAPSPKIGGNITGLLEELANYAQQNNIDLSGTPIPFTGIVRLHGAQANLYHWPGWRVRSQIWNTETSMEEKNKPDFKTFCAEKNKAIERLIDRLKQRWYKVHPGETLSSNVLILAGKWVEANAQRASPQIQMQRRFVLFGLSINGVWEQMEDYADLEDPTAGLLNISNGGFFHLDLSVDDNGEAFLRKAALLTSEVTRSSPFSHTLGVNEPADGIVWMPSARATVPNAPNFWLETKGREFSGRGWRETDQPNIGRSRSRESRRSATSERSRAAKSEECKSSLELLADV